MKKILPLLLAFSVLINIFLVYEVTANAKVMNITWFNFTTSFSKAIQASRINLEDNATIALEYEKLKRLQQQFFSLQDLPKGAQIISVDTITNLESLFNYQFSILELMKQELKDTGKISDDTKKKYLKVEQSWDGISMSFNSQLEKLDSFSSVFKEDNWEVLFKTAINSKNVVELLPLTKIKFKG